MESRYHVPRLIEIGLADAAERGTHLATLGMLGREYDTDDLGDMPLDATFVQTSGDAVAIERLGLARSLRVASIQGVNESVMRALSRASELVVLSLHRARTDDLSRLQGCTALQHLSISWAPRCADLGFLAPMADLRALWLRDLKRLDIATLPELPALSALALRPGMSSELRLASLEPLLRLAGLKHLSVLARVTDDSLHRLSSLPHLETLELPLGLFTLEDRARLSGALGPERGPRLVGFCEPTEGRCKTCSSPVVGVPGRSPAWLCSECHAPRLERLRQRWMNAGGIEPRPIDEPADAEPVVHLVDRLVEQHHEEQLARVLNAANAALQSDDEE